MKEKPCNVCVEFKTARKSYASSKNDASSKTGQLPSPPDGGQLGRSTWTFLHTMAAFYPESPSHSDQNSMIGFIEGLSKFYPCSDCAEHLQQEIVKSPPKVKSNVELSDWFCMIHNEVNIRQGKPVFDCAKVFERWREQSNVKE